MKVPARKFNGSAFSLVAFALLVAFLLFSGDIRDAVSKNYFLPKSRAKAEQGDAKAQFDLGHSYFMATDYAEAVRWFRKAAEQNYAKAQGYLACCYYDEHGVARDHAEALRWARKAAAQGDAVGEVVLGCCYRNGQGVPKDAVEAYAWVNLAVEISKDSLAASWREIWAKEMSPRQLEDGKKRTEELRAQFNAKAEKGGH